MMKGISKLICILSFLALVSCGDGVNLTKTETKSEPTLSDDPKDLPEPTTPPQTPESPKPCDDRPKCETCPKSANTETCPKCETCPKSANTETCPKCEKSTSQTEKEKAEMDEKIKQYKRLVNDLDDKKKALQDLYDKQAQSVDKKLNWKNVNSAAKLHLTASTVRDSELTDEAHEQKIGERADNVTNFILFLHFEKAHLKEACYSQDITEIQKKCVPFYVEYADVLSNNSTSV